MPLTPTGSASTLVALEAVITEDRTEIALFWTYSVLVGSNTLQYVVEQHGITPDSDYGDGDMPTISAQNSVLAAYGYVLP